jgi:23S rRNA (guanosine2251-2'-O)-methyltransferase
MEIVYGLNPIAEVIRAKRRRLIKLYAQDPKRFGTLMNKVETQLSEPKYESRGALIAMSGSPHHQGLVAEVENYPYVELDEVFENPQQFLLALDNLTDPQNVGAILRSAYCAGVSGVTLRSHHAASITASVLKASAGAAEHLSISLVSNQSKVLEKAKEEGYFSVALDMEGSPLYKAKIPWKRPVLLLVGAEDQGVSAILKKHVDLTVKIPMKGILDSLNASVAAALALFEIARNRE